LKISEKSFSTHTPVYVNNHAGPAFHCPQETKERPTPLV